MLKNQQQQTIFLIIVSLLVSVSYNFQRFSDSIISAFIHAVALSLFIFGTIGLTKRIGPPRLLLSIFYAVPLFFRIAYDSNPTVGSLMSLVSTNPPEAISFLSENIIYLILSTLIFTIIWITPSIKISKNVSKVLLLTGLSYVFIGSIKDYTSKNESEVKELELKYTAKNYQNPVTRKTLLLLDFATLRLPSLSLLVSTSDTIKFYLTQSNATKDSWEYIEKPPFSNKLFVIIIGESQRADHLGLFSYAKNTTPNLNTIKDALHSIKAVSGGTNTWTSLPAILSLSDMQGHVDISRNIINLSNKAGYKTWWISNQAQISRWDFGVSSIANQSDYSFFSSEEGYKNIPPDSAILPRFLKILKMAKNNPENDLVILHLYGSHPDFEDRYPDNFNIFNNSSVASKYDNSMLFTDSVLYRAFRIIKRFDGDFIYFADHGLVNESSPRLAYKHDVRDKPSLDSVIVPFLSNKDLGLTEAVNLYFFECIFSKWTEIQTKEINKDHCKNATGSEYGFFLDAKLALHKEKYPKGKPKQPSN